MLVYYFVPFIVSNRHLLFWVSNGHNPVTVQNRTHVYMNYFDHKDLGNHLLQLCPKVVKHPVCSRSRFVFKRLKGPCFLSRDDYERKTRARIQRTVGKYYFVNRTVKLRKSVATFPCKFRKRLRRVIISEKRRVVEAWWRNVQKCRKVKNGEWCDVNEGKGCEVKWSGDLGWNVCIITDLYLC